MTEAEVREQCQRGIQEALTGLDQELAAQVLEQAAALPYDGDIGVLVEQVTAITQKVWTAKIEAVDARLAALAAQQEALQKENERIEAQRTTWERIFAAFGRKNKKSDTIH